MNRQPITQVVVCAGGLGTRVAPWARHLPKEFTPVAGRPGILHLLDELTALAPAQVTVVYHPFYEPFIAWAKTTLSRGGQAAYQRAARLPRTDLPLHEQLDLSFIPQRGRYADVTSVLNGADHLHANADVFVAFADNLYPHDNPSLALAAVPTGQTAVLVRPYHAAEVGHRGVVVSHHDGDALVVADLVEKPSPERARELEDEHGAAGLWLLEGRARLTRAFVDQLRRAPMDPGREPKLSLAIRRCAQRQPVRLVVTHSTVTDLGNPAADWPVTALVR
ncbi:sugar phosphate nucleotidyltransferase [Micromonospora aurantiaca (nom. illeg.)]|uniref:sugar phosphate nucleotidyltransferase n=1 Tax=Micromonospora aurantiaca (nom. illeg.) TaxID=47850 RepID=UPI0037A5894C